MSVVACPKCGSNNIYYKKETGVHECLKCGHKWKQPTMKELMAGTVLDGFIEAQRTKPLTEFMATKMSEVDELKRTMLKASDVGDWDTYNKAKEKRNQLIREMQEEEKAQKKILWHGNEYYAYGSAARPLDWLTIKDSITSVSATALTRLSRAIDFSSEEPYFNIILSPTQLKPEEIKSLELTPLEALSQPKEATRTIIIDGRNVVVAYEEDPKLRRESGWYVVRDYNPVTLEWVDHARPGYGVTWWITLEEAERYGLEHESVSSSETPLLFKETRDEIVAAVAEEKEAIDDYAELINKLRKAGLNSEADIVTEIRNDERDHKVKFEEMLKRIT
jgi:hypothetical protein